MFRIGLPKRRGLTVTGVTGDAGTLASMVQYFKGRVSFRAVPDLSQAFRVSASSDAVVFYPDEFEQKMGLRFLLMSIGNATLSLIVVVTSDPGQFQAVAYSRGAVDKCIVLSKPIWPWELLATIQAGVPGYRRGTSRLC